ncbi:DMT family transporter [Siminovitchia sediminis]|uniref:DMT family transporter n=1 Tax=Siminovitchia sediminis TaxID=1274353 RepID=A0ABW4KEV7_9BACI
MVNNKIIGYSCLAVAASFWGAMYVVGKFVMAHISPFVVLWLRYLVAFTILFFISYVIKKERIHKSDLPFMAWLGFVGYFLSNGGAFVGTHLSSAQLGSLIAATPPVFTMFLAAWILKEKLTVTKIISILLAVLGLFIVVGIRFEHTQEQFILGAFILILGSLAWALYTVFVKGVRYSALLVSTYATGFGIVFTTPVMIWEFQREDLVHLMDLSSVLSILYLGIAATALAFFLWNTGMQYVEAGVGSIFTFLNTVVGGFLGWLFLKEPLNWNFFVGSLLVLMAIVLILYKDERPVESNRDALGKLQKQAYGWKIKKGS